MGIIGVALKKTPSGGIWQVHFDNTQWGPLSSTTWTGSSWSSSGFEILLVTFVGWASGYRPTKVRASFTGPATADLRLYDSSLNIIASNASYVSGAEENITFVGNDILRFGLGYGAMTCTNIEFFVP